MDGIEGGTHALVTFFSHIVSAVLWKTKLGIFFSLFLTQAYLPFEAVSAEWLSYLWRQ